MSIVVFTDAFFEHKPSDHLRQESIVVSVPGLWYCLGPEMAPWTGRPLLKPVQISPNH